jgi:hypothetical protein
MLAAQSQIKKFNGVDENCTGRMMMYHSLAVPFMKF